MLSLFTKKKVSEDKVANVFVNSILTLVEGTFADVASIINEDPEFAVNPKIPDHASDKFLLVVVAGNIEFIPDHFSDYQDVRLIDRIFSKLSQALGVEKDRLKAAIAKYQSLFSKLNHPSKNTHYAMSKAVFHQYDLYDYQQEYFRKMRAPNPIFLKRLDEVMASYIWDWEGYKQKHRITA